jgi:flagellar basal-body rod protein FlgC
MTFAFGISTSGLHASAKRIAVAADNIANVNSTKQLQNGQVVNEPYHAKKTQTISNALGGVFKVEVLDANPPTKTMFNPNADNADANGSSEVPNVDLAQEMIDQRIASYDFKANLKSIKVQDNMLQNLLDIKS